MFGISGLVRGAIILTIVLTLSYFVFNRSGPTLAFSEPTPIPLPPAPPTPFIITAQSSQTISPTTVVINEVAWSGTTASGTDEWLELHNTTAQTLVLDGWTITSTRGLNIVLSGEIKGGGFYLLERTDDTTIANIPADQIYTGSLNNNGDTLFLSDGTTLVDTANLSGGDWPAGANTTGRPSMERVNPAEPDSPQNWGSNDQTHRNGLDAGGNPINSTPDQPNSTTYSSPPPPPSTPPDTGLVINEIAWAGTVASGTDEWLELHNITTQTLTLDGWTITSTRSLNIALAGTIGPGGFFLLERTDDTTISDMVADQLYTGSLNNDGDTLFLSNGVVTVDTANLVGNAWPAGDASGERLSMERVNPAEPDLPENWRDHDPAHRNGLDAGGNPINGTPGQPNSTTYPPPPPPPPPPDEGIVINEIAWGGTGASSSDEWLELHNITTQTVTLDGWTITSTRGLTLLLSGVISPDGFYIMERGDDQTLSDYSANYIYSGGLNNQGDTLFLHNGQILVDTANLNAPAWPAGSGSPDYLSMERVNPAEPDSPQNWQSNDLRHRNGLAADNSPINGTPGQPNSTTYPPPPVIPLLISEVLYDGLTKGTEGDEFIEVCNPTTEAADLTGYKIGDEESAGNGEGMYRFPNGQTLTPGDCLVTAKNAADFLARFGRLPDFEVVASGQDYTDTLTVPNLSKYRTWGSGSWALSNNSDELLLLGPADQILDAVAYRNGDYDVLGLTPGAQASEPESLQRIWPLDTDWMTADFFRAEPSPGQSTPLPDPNPLPAPHLPEDMNTTMKAYFGLFGAYTTLSGGTEPPLLRLAQARAEGLHFLALTDPGHVFDPTSWAALQTWADEATQSGEFIALPGVTWTHEDFGSLSLFGLTEPVHPDFPPTANLAALYAYLQARPNSLAQLHADFEPAFYDADIAPQIVLHATETLTQLQTSWAQGWHVAPSNNAAAKTTARTGIIASELTPQTLARALRARRVFATEDSNLVLAFRAGSAWMGSLLEPGPLNLEVAMIDPDGEPTVLTLYDRTVPLLTRDLNPNATGSTVLPIQLEAQAGHFYWFKAEQSDGDLAYTAPIWITGTPPLETILINEFLPAPSGFDWDGDGDSDSNDEWVELYNPTPFPVDLSGWSISDETDKTYTLPPGVIIEPGRYHLIYRNQSKIALNNSGDTLFLYRADRSLADQISYDTNPGDNVAICRLPDGGAWHDRCLPSRFGPNVELPPAEPLRLSIYDAKRVTDGAWVRVKGFVTVPPNVFGKNLFYIQDETHGIRVKLPSGHNLHFDLGQGVEVTGYLDLQRNEWEIEVKDPGEVSVLDETWLVPPLPIGSGLLREGYEGLLVQLNVEPVAFQKGRSHFWVDDGTGLAYIYIHSKTKIKRRGLTLDAPMTIVGIAGQNTQSDPPIDGYRLYPRYQSDIIQQHNDEAASLPSPAPANWPTLLPETGFKPNSLAPCRRICYR